MCDREDELRRSIASDRMASRMLAAMAAEKMAKVGLFEEGIKEQMRLREQLLGDRAWYMEEIARVRAETARIRAETARIKAELGPAAAAAVAASWRGGGGSGKGGGKKKEKRRPDGGRAGRSAAPAT